MPQSAVCYTVQVCTILSLLVTAMQVLVLCRDYNCDSTTIRLQSDYRTTYRALLIQFDASKHVSFSS